MTESLGLVDWARAQLLRWRWPIVALAGVVFSAMEVHEHRFAATMVAESEFIREVLLFGIVGPVLAGLALSLVMHTTEERVQAYQRLDLEHELSRQLARAHSWEELTALVVRFPRKLLPLMGALLLVRGQDQDQYDVADEWWNPEGRLPARPRLDCIPDPCLASATGHFSLSPALFRCHCLDSVEPPELGNRYCLPLVQGDSLVAMLYQYLPPGVQPAADQIDCLNALAPSMALALDAARPHRAAAVEAAAIESERQRIARDLHDTLGQSLGYLHLKLDQLSGDDALREIGEIRRELERMRLVASESYAQVRSTVAGLHASPSTELVTLLQQTARTVGERSGFEVQLSSEGPARPLDPHVQRHVVYIVREAFNNVEKHADARRVGLDLLWGDGTLTVIFADDGRGFDPNSCATNGHFGLGIMRQRAEEIGGELIINAAPGSGTELILSVPIAAPIQDSNGGGR